MYVCMYVCMYVYMYVCVFACMHIHRAAGSGGAGAAMAAPQFLISHASDKMSHTFYCRSKKVVLAHVLAKRLN